MDATEEEYDVPQLREQLLAHLGRDNADCYPSHLERLFPRILSKIVTYWGQAKLDAYLDELMVPERPGRKGFPGEVAMEIFRLATVHSALGLTKVDQGTGWAGVENADLYRKALKKDCDNACN